MSDAAFIRCKTPSWGGLTEVQVPWTPFLTTISDLKAELMRSWPEIVHEDDRTDEEEEEPEDYNEEERAEATRKRAQRRSANIAMLYFGKLLKDNDRLGRLGTLKHNLDHEFVVCVRKGDLCRRSRPPCRGMLSGLAQIRGLEMELETAELSLSTALQYSGPFGQRGAQRSGSRGAHALSVSSGVRSRPFTRLGRINRTRDDETSQLLNTAGRLRGDGSGGGGLTLGSLLIDGQDGGDDTYDGGDEDAPSAESLGASSLSSIMGLFEGLQSMGPLGSEGPASAYSSDEDMPALEGEELTDFDSLFGPELRSRSETVLGSIHLLAGGEPIPPSEDSTRLRAEDTAWTFCARCGADGPEFQCSLCSQAAYCSEECQHADWKAHKAACKMNREPESLS